MPTSGSNLTPPPVSQHASSCGIVVVVHGIVVVGAIVVVVGATVVVVVTGAHAV